MLKTPQHGWSQITIGNWSDRCSYLDDVPILLLKNIERVCRTHSPTALRLDAEGWEYLIVFDFFETHIITEADNGYSLQTEMVSIQSLAKALIANIRRDLELWVCWNRDEKPEVNSALKRRTLLSSWCDLLESRIKGRYSK